MSKILYEDHNKKGPKPSKCNGRTTFNIWLHLYNSVDKIFRITLQNRTGEHPN